MNTPDLVFQRCRNHAQREAVARCKGCGGYFCRECVTEHKARIYCATCLRREAGKTLLRRRGVVAVFKAAQCGVGLLVAWLFFYSIGRGLLSVPDSFHETTLWKSPGPGP